MLRTVTDIAFYSINLISHYASSLILHSRRNKMKTLLLLLYPYSCPQKHSFSKYFLGATKYRQDTVSCLQDRYNLLGNKDKYM